MDIIFRENVLCHLLKPCIETYFNGRHEFIGQLYGIKEKDRFILEDVFIDVTAKSKKDSVNPIPYKIHRQVSQNLEGLTMWDNIGDVHSHIITTNDINDSKNKKEYFNDLNAFGTPSKGDKTTMKKDNQHIYLITTLCERKYQIKWGYATNEKNLIGNTKDVTFHISAWYFNTRKRRFQTAKIIASLPIERHINS